MLIKCFPRSLYKTVQLCCILSAALAISACSSSSDSSGPVTSSAASSVSSVSSVSSASSSSESSAGYTGDPAEGKELIATATLCAGCHQDREDGTFTGTAFNVNDLREIEDATEKSLADYIEAEMPPGASASNCVGQCAADIAAYLWTYKRENLLTDGGFEGSDYIGWTSWNDSTLALTADRFYAGLQSLQVSNRPEEGAYAVYDLTELIEADTTYTVRAMAMHTGDEPDTLRMIAKIECTDETMPEGHNTYPWLHNLEDVPAEQWTLLTSNLEIPACDVVEAVISFEGTSAGVNVYLDEVYVTPQTPSDAPEPSDNLLTNGDFESGTEGWANWDEHAMISASQDEAYTGTYSLHVDRTASTGDGSHAAVDVTAIVTPGSNYTFTAWAKHKGEAPEDLRAAAKIECSAETAPEGHNTYPWVNNAADAASDEWTQLSGPLPVPDCDLVEVAIYFEGTSEGVDVYIDAVSLTQD